MKKLRYWIERGMEEEGRRIKLNGRSRCTKISRSRKDHVFRLDAHLRITCITIGTLKTYQFTSLTNDLQNDYGKCIFQKIGLITSCRPRLKFTHYKKQTIPDQSGQVDSGKNPLRVLAEVYGTGRVGNEFRSPEEYIIN